LVGNACGNLAAGGFNTGLGVTAFNDLAGGVSNVAIGFGALFSSTTGSNNVAIGRAALAAGNQSQNTGIGFQAGENLGTSSNNICIGYQVMGFNGDNNCIRIGDTTTGTANNTTRIGTNGTQTAAYIAGIDNVNLGTLTVVTESADQLGTATLVAGTGIIITTTTANEIIISASGGGGGASSFPTDSGTATPSGGVLNIIAGLSSQNCGSTVEFTGAGNTVELNVTDVNNNTIIGKGAGNGAITGFGDNTCIGMGVAASLSNGAFNTAVGFQSLNNLGSGQSNVAIGYRSMFNSTTGFTNVAIGRQSAQFMNGQNNTVIGDLALNLTTNGDNNIVIGASAGANYHNSNESNNILIANAGVLGESNVIRIGTEGTQTAAYMAGIFGETVDLGTGIPVFVDNGGKLGTILSSARYKENIEDMDDYSSDIMQLRPVTFNYKNQSPDVTSVGLIAEEVEEILPQLVIYNKDGQPETVKYQDLPVLLLNELQKLTKKYEFEKSIQDQAIEKLMQKVAELEKKLEEKTKN